MTSRAEADSSATPSARFLQARITALSTTLIKRLENIFAAALEDDQYQTGPPTDGSNPPSLTDTSVKQLQLDVESSALVRAAEDLMILTRTMKELWLFGDLDTIPEDNKGHTEQTTEAMRSLDADEQLVVEGFLDYLSQVNGQKDGK